MKSNNFVLEIFSDASTSGRGASCYDETAHGYWDEKERTLHINYLELQSAFLAWSVLQKIQRIVISYYK